MIPALLACAEPPNAPALDAACDEPGVACIAMGRLGVPGVSADGLPARDTMLYIPQDVTPAPDGGFYVADSNNHVVRRVGPDGVSRIVVGDGWPNGGTEGPATEQSVKFPAGVVFDPFDPEVVWLALSGLHLVGRLEDGLLELPYGVTQAGYAGDGGPAAFAQFAYPSSVAFDEDGALYVSDRLNQVVRRIADGIVETVVGTPQVQGYAGDGGPASEAQLASVSSQWDPGSRIWIEDGRMLLADTGNHAVRAVDLETFTIETVADGFLEPYDVTVGPDGAIHVADTGNACVRAIEPDGGLRTVAGICGEPGELAEGLPATEVHLGAPVAIAFDARGDLFVADAIQHVVVRIPAR